MYDTLARDDELEPLSRGRDPALFHDGDHGRLLRVHEDHAARAATGRHPGLPPVGPYLMPRLADARTMMAACDDLLRRGAKAPGPDRLRLEELTVGERWSLCRRLAQAVRDGTYRPGPDRRVRVPKEGRPGEHRELAVQNAADRVVGRAAVRVLQPVLEPAFSPLSFGFRPGRGAQAALATALALAEADGRWAWASADVARAFDRIPFNRFLDACRTYFPPDVVEFVDLVARTGGRRGLRQGSPASPLFANAYFDHVLYGPWHAARPDLPLLRYADDLLVPCRSAAEAAAAHAALAGRLTAAGTPLKGTAGTDVHDLTAGASVDWLGYRVRLAGDGPAVLVADHAWRALGGRLAEAHLRPASPVRAAQVVRGWLAYLGPCYPYEDRPGTLERVRRAAASLAFDEIPGERELTRVWRAAYARWCRLRRGEAARLPHRRQRVREWAGRRPRPSRPSGDGRPGRQDDPAVGAVDGRGAE